MKSILKRLLALLAVALIGPVVILFRPDLASEQLEAQYTDSASRFLKWGGLRIHYKDEGAGPALLLIHGTASSLHTWDGWVGELEDQFRLVRLDLPGFGLTGPEPEHDYSTARRVEVLTALLDHLQVDRCSVAGNSLGGYIAWQFAARRPERVDQLVLIDAAGYPKHSSTEMTVMDLGRIPVLSTVLAKLTPRFLIAAGVRESYGDPDLATPEVIDRYYRLIRREGNRQALLLGLNNKRPIEIDLIRSISQTTLVMWGEDDRLIAVELAERFHRDLPNSELIIYPNIGHVPMEEIPVRSAQEAATFLGRPLELEMSVPP